MAFTYGFYNSVNHDRKYDAVQMGMIFDGIITDGIYATYLKAMVVKASENASEVIVQPGRAWFNHTWSYNDSDYPIATPDPEVVLDRIDTLVLDINAEDASRENSFLWVQGTPTSQIPEPPELIHTATHNQYPLCDVYRKAGTTQIYAADITNRVGTSDCPFVTGVLESINIDDLLSQWDDEFHTWERATKSAFEGWMVNQQSVYTAWWDALKLQMAGDVADVEAWVASLHDILDSETASHLQLEIDEIKTLLPTGSYIKVTTPDPELRNKTVTITDENNESVTSTFNAQGVAEFKTVPLIGNLTITSTDGIRTATTVENIEYFSKYSYVLAFWNATVNIQGDEQLGGSTVSIYDSSSLIGTVVLNAEGEGSFSATYPDTYTFSVTFQGETYSQELEVSQETTYTVSLSIGFSYSKWLEYGEVTGTYASLDDVLEDKRAVRKLMTKHDSVDYLASAVAVSNDISKILNNDLCAKWINLRDYALDTLHANQTLAAVMDEADKYFYGELALIPQVPKMTGNTTPYGACTATTNSASAYKAFNGTNESGTSDAYEASLVPYRIAYQSILPVCVTDFLVANRNNSTVYAIKDFTIQGSNDGTNWVDLGSFTKQDGQANAEHYHINNTTKYTHYAIYVTSVYDASSNHYSRIGMIQFYSWGPKGCVPIMTANNAPYGVASVVKSGEETVLEAWKSFADDGSTGCLVQNALPARLIYKFTNPTCIKRFTTMYPSSTDCMTEYSIDVSNDGTNWTTLESVVNDGSAGMHTTDFPNNTQFCLYVSINATKRNPSQSVNLKFGQCQFYGRQLSVSVPKMTSNTAPYGTVSGNGSGNYGSYHAFSNNDYAWNSGNLNAIYDFGKPVVVKAFSIASWHYGSNSYKIIGSNDGSTWTDVLSNIKTVIPSLGDSAVGYANVENTTAYRYYGFEVGNSDSYLYPGCNFYGLDYSEREFEEGTNKKWLYDHGLELEPINVYPNAEKTTEYLAVANQNSSVNANYFEVSGINLANYSLVRAIAEDVFAGNNGYLNIGKPTQAVAYNAFGTNPNTINLDISSVDSGSLVITGNAASRITEWWLEQ